MSVSAARRLVMSTLAIALLAVVGAKPVAASRDRDCADFSSQAQAQRFYKKHGGPKRDPHRLDADRDGIACEALS